MKALLPMNRPEVLAGDVAPVIQTPAHSAFPSGHATEAFAAAAVLGALYPARLGQLRRLAARIAVNRGFAGVHYPVDHLAGAMLGDMLGAHVVEKVFGVTMLAQGIQFPATLVAGEDPNGAAWDEVEDYALGLGLLRMQAAPACARNTVAALPDSLLTRIARAVSGDVLGAP